jgi:hypothetical protein
MAHFRGTPEGKTQVLVGNIEVLACNVSEVAEDIKGKSVPNPQDHGHAQGFWRYLTGLGIVEPVSNDFEARLSRHNRHIENWRPETGA